MSKENGFLPLRRGLWEHVRDGRMSITEALAFIYICSQADTRTGIWKGCSKSLSGELGIPERTARDVLEKMEHGDYIRRFAVPGRHICYPILIHKFLITQGEHNGEHLNAKESTTPADLRYISREQGVEQGVEHSVEHGAAQRRSEKREERKAKPCFALPDWVPLETWNEFLEMRESLRATPTEKAKALLVEKLQKLKCSGQDPKSVLEQSIERSWKGVFPVSTFYWLAAETGMRAGELCGLRVDHIDLGRGLVKVSQSAWHGKFQNPKSENAVRTFAISSRLREHLRGFLAKWRPNADHLVFATRNGTPWDANLLVKRKLRPLLLSLGIEGGGLHGFRHGTASMMDELSVPMKVRQQRLGHSDPRLTMNVYTHMASADDERIAEQLGDLLDAVGQKRSHDARNEKRVCFAANPCELEKMAWLRGAALY